MAVMFTPLPGFLASPMNWQVMCLPFVSIVRSEKLVLTCHEVDFHTLLFLPLFHRHFIPLVFLLLASSLSFLISC